MFEDISRADTLAPDARPAIAVYRKGDELVIRQRHPLSNEEPYIIVPLAGAEDLVQAIRRELNSGKLEKIPEK